MACIVAVGWELFTRPQQRGLWLLLILAAASLLLGRLHGAEFKSGFFSVFIYAPLLFGLVLDRAGPFWALALSGSLTAASCLALFLLPATDRPMAVKVGTPAAR